MDGVLNIDKPSGITSHDVVSRARRILQTRRMGHAGTLDPMATGVLLLCAGKATRIVEFLMGEEKEYRGAVTLGVTTDTEDSSGAVLSEIDASQVTKEQIEAVLPRFLGRIRQTPPMVSAAHHEGKRLYELARKGVVVEREPRDVEIRELEMLDFHAGPHPQATLRIVCSKGVYIRTLFADIGAALGVGAHMSALTRTRIGRFVIEDAINLDTLAVLVDEATIPEALIPMSEALSELPKVDISRDTVEDVRHGRIVPLPGGVSLQEGAVVRLIRNDELVALARVVKRDDVIALQPDKVFL